MFLRATILILAVKNVPHVPRKKVIKAGPLNGLSISCFSMKKCLLKKIIVNYQALNPSMGMWLDTKVYKCIAAVSKCICKSNSILHSKERCKKKTTVLLQRIVQIASLLWPRKYFLALK